MVFGMIVLAFTTTFAGIQLIREVRSRRAYRKALSALPKHERNLHYALLTEAEVQVGVHEVHIVNYPTREQACRLGYYTLEIYRRRLAGRRELIEAASTTLSVLGPLLFALLVVPAGKLAWRVFSASSNSITAPLLSSEYWRPAGSAGLIVFLATLLALPATVALLSRTAIAAIGSLDKSYAAWPKC